jgi:hypothetical protein
MPVANITEKKIDGTTDYVQIFSQPLIITVYKTSWGPHLEFIDPQEQALIHKQNLLKNNDNITIIQDIFTSVYDGNVGSTFVTFDSGFRATDVYTFIESGNYIYEFNIMGIVSNSNATDTFNKVLGSIKFFN